MNQIIKTKHVDFNKLIKNSTAGHVTSSNGHVTSSNGHVTSTGRSSHLLGNITI